MSKKILFLVLLAFIVRLLFVTTFSSAVPTHDGKVYDNLALQISSDPTFFISDNVSFLCDLVSRFTYSDVQPHAIKQCIETMNPKEQ